jgi:predicted nucleotidyltransferase
MLGEGVQVLLFGSRIDDNRKGSDIDLYIQGLQLDLQTQQFVKARFFAKLKQSIGEQRIDVMFAQALCNPCCPSTSLLKAQALFSNPGAKQLKQIIEFKLRPAPHLLRLL